MSIRSKRDLEVELSKLQGFVSPRVELEQYALTSSIAADWIWQMALRGEIAGKVILDAGCGPGILGLGVLLMGAKRVFFVDKDEEAIKICRENYKVLHAEYEIGEGEFMVHDIRLFDAEVDVVIENPPFGTKVEHADKIFLEKAFASARVVYSMHKKSTMKFVEAITRDFGFVITHTYQYEFPIKAQFVFHEKRVEHVEVMVFRMERG